MASVWCGPGFRREAPLSRPESLDEHTPLADFPLNGEVEAACRLDNDRIVISTTPEQALDGPEGDELQPNGLGVWSIQERRWVSRCTPRHRVGTMHELDGQVLALFGYPKLLDPSSGRVVDEWPDIDTGRQDSSIRSQDGTQVPPVAVDSHGRRFAVANGSDVVIVDVSHG